LAKGEAIGIEMTIVDLTLDLISLDDTPSTFSIFRDGPYRCIIERLRIGYVQVTERRRRGSSLVVLDDCVILEGGIASTTTSQTQDFAFVDIKHHIASMSAKWNLVAQSYLVHVRVRKDLGLQNPDRHAATRWTVQVVDYERVGCSH
jgi:hypothetical protein